MTQATELFSPPTVRLTTEQAEAIAWARYGLRGPARALAGERDQNFHIQTEEGPGFVLKIHPPSEDPAVVDLQVKCLLHIARADQTLMVPRVLPSVDGALVESLDLGEEKPQLVRVLSYLPGVLLAEHRPLNEARLRSFGAALARLNRAMRGFFHPAGGYVLLWDLQRASQLRPMLSHIPTDEARALATEALDRFEARALPALPRLRAQPIHNDSNPNNVLFDPIDTEQVAGFLDFGDLVHAPLIDELAVAASYNLAKGSDPLASVRVLVAGYHAVNPLEAEELDLLLDLILARAVLSIAISSWQAAINPEERAELLEYLPMQEDRLRRLLALSPEESAEALRAACGLETAMIGAKDA